MEALNKFPEDYSKNFKFSFKLLNLCNIRYLQDNESFIQKYWRFIYLALAALIHLIVFGVHLVTQLSKREMLDFAYMLPVYLVCIRSIIKAFIIISKNEETTEIIKELGSMWRTKYTKEQLVKKSKLLRTLNICISANYWVGCLGLSQFLSAPLFDILFRRIILHQQYELTVPVSYPFNINHNWLLYLPVFTFQCFIMALTVFLHLGSWLLMIVLYGLLVIEFTMLQDDLSRVKPIQNTTQNSNDVHDYSIAAFVQKHQKLIRLSKQLDNVYNQIVFIDLLFVGIITCTFTFAGQFARSKMYTIYNYMGVTCSMVTVLCMCYYGELLTEASGRLGDIAYETLWYEGDKHYSKAIWLIMQISEKPCCLTSIRYAKISLRTFTKVISTTWSYLSLMNTVYAEE